MALRSPRMLREKISREMRSLPWTGRGVTGSASATCLPGKAEPSWRPRPSSSGRLTAASEWPAASRKSPSNPAAGVTRRSVLRLSTSEAVRESTSISASRRWLTRKSPGTQASGRAARLALSTGPRGARARVLPLQGHAVGADRRVGGTPRSGMPLRSAERLGHVEGLGLKGRWSGRTSSFLAGPGRRLP